MNVIQTVREEKVRRSCGSSFPWPNEFAFLTATDVLHPLNRVRGVGESASVQSDISAAYIVAFDNNRHIKSKGPGSRPYTDCKCGDKFLFELRRQHPQ